MFQTPPLSYAGDLVRRLDRDRFLTALFVHPHSLRENLLTLYAFNVELARIRETVTEPMIGKMRLQWWRDVVTGIGEGKDPPSGHPVAEPFAKTMRDAHLSTDLLLDLIDARERDLEEIPTPSYKDLELYCRGTSAYLSVLALECLGVRDSTTVQVAEDIGLAWALTGLIRATPHHARTGAVFLPADAVADVRLTQQDLSNPSSGETLKPLVKRIADDAEQALRQARERRNAIDLRGLAALLPATLADVYLKRLKRAEYDVFAAGASGLGPPVARLFWKGWRKRY